VLRIDDLELIDRSTEDRFQELARVLPAEALVPRLVTGDAGAAQAFFDAALAQGHEGVMAKALNAPYEAGSRGSSWLKIKQAHTLDLVILAAEWGHGRRRGWLSNLHLGARDPASGQFIMLGKTFKGLTDQMLEWQTQKLLEIETSRDEYTVYVRPQIVVEIALNEIQESPQYPAGMALRFARVKGYRSDKRPEEADTVDTVRKLHAAHVGV
jgi:DNA ligase-1